MYQCTQSFAYVMETFKIHSIKKTIVAVCDTGGRIKVYITDCLVACHGLAACVLSVIMPHSTADRLEDPEGERGWNEER